MCLAVLIRVQEVRGSNLQTLAKTLVYVALTALRLLLRHCMKSALKMEAAFSTDAYVPVYHCARYQVGEQLLSAVRTEQDLWIVNDTCSALPLGCPQ